MSFPLESLYTWYRQQIANPKYRWWIIAGTLVYLLSPFDLAPDFIPVLGQLDDALIVTVLVAELSQIVLGWVRNTKSNQESKSETDSAVTTVEAPVIPIE